MVIWPTVNSYDETFRTEIKFKRFSEEWFRSLPKEEFFIASPNGYDLHAVYIPAPGRSDKTIIFVHGHRFSLMGDYKYLTMFRKRGYNALLFDSRYHGKSGGENTTFGVYEKKDLEACVDWVMRRNGPDSLVGVHGESMGSAVCVMHAAKDQRPAFYILDGCMADLSRLLEYRLWHTYRLPPQPIVDAASIVSKLRGGIFFGDVSPILEIKKAGAAFLFIHGEKDNEIPPLNSEHLYQECRGMKKIWICPGAGHSKSIFIQPDEYDRRVGEFLAMVEKNKVR
jgi:fermentation-respiration switch protein FrsA (DUF1100 family)